MAKTKKNTAEAAVTAAVPAGYVPILIYHGNAGAEACEDYHQPGHR